MTTYSIEETISEYCNAIHTADQETLKELFLTSATIIDYDKKGTIVKQSPSEYARTIAQSLEPDSDNLLHALIGARDEVVSIDFSAEDVAIVKLRIFSRNYSSDELLSLRNTSLGWRIAGRILSELSPLPESNRTVIKTA